MMKFKYRLLEYAYEQVGFTRSIVILPHRE